MSSYRRQLISGGGRWGRPVEGLRLPPGHEDLEPDDGEGEDDGERAGGQDGGDGAAQGKVSIVVRMRKRKRGGRGGDEAA